MRTWDYQLRRNHSGFPNHITKYLSGDNDVLRDRSNLDLRDACGLQYPHAEHATRLRNNNNLERYSLGEGRGIKAVVL